MPNDLQGELLLLLLLLLPAAVCSCACFAVAAAECEDGEVERCVGALRVHQTRAREHLERFLVAAQRKKESPSLQGHGRKEDETLDI